ncbi:hypothetical protein BDB01DRAFT_727734 [Pilobolus umbonatus]|nr:hypothetical protein BDB01DRAFT_727734 [Pilobolus umbonatus]
MTQTYSPGTIVFAKLKGFPWWPAKVEDDLTVPVHILSQKSKSKGNQYTVCFYGTQDYGFFGHDAIRSFDPVSVEKDMAAKKFKSKDLESAVIEALNELTSPKRRRESVDGERKKRVMQEARLTFYLQCTEDTETRQKVYTLRRKLQRLVYNKKEGEIPKEDYSKIVSLIDEIEETPITYPILKDTKIGKVVKAACTYPFENDYKMINDRCQRLMKHWKMHFINQINQGLQ